MFLALSLTHPVWISPVLRLDDFLLALLKAPLIFEEMIRDGIPACWTRGSWGAPGFHWRLNHDPKKESQKSFLPWAWLNVCLPTESPALESKGLLTHFYIPSAYHFVKPLVEKVFNKCMLSFITLSIFPPPTRTYYRSTENSEISRCQGSGEINHSQG